MTDLAVANTILEQLGGARFRAMTGAKSLVGAEDALHFQLPRGFAKSGIDRVTVRLTAMDVYDVTFGKWNGRALTIKPVAAVQGVYADDLRRIFTDATGLDCTMGQRRAA